VDCILVIGKQNNVHHLLPVLKALQVKLADFAGRFYDFGTGLFKFGVPFASWLRRHLSKSPALFGVELLVAISLSVNYYFLMIPEPAAPRQIDGNEMNAYLFTYLSDHPYSHKDIAEEFTSWKGRLAGPMISGRAYDLALKLNPTPAGAQTPDFNVASYSYNFNINTRIFGCYHAIWLFLLFLILILHRKDALWIMLGVFSGLMYNLIIPAGQWFYPWDMPAMLFFTWACLLYDKRKLFPLMIVVWLGSLFKETTLCCTLLILLSDHWTLKKRVVGFATTVFACLLTKKLLMAAYGVNTMLFVLNHTANIQEMVFKSWSVLVSNLNYLLSLNLNHALFINAGTLFIMMLIPWRTRRDVVFKILILSFVICAFLFGGYSIFAEFRDWYELLPLGWMVITENLSSYFPVVLGGQTGKEMLQPDLTSRVMKGSYWLVIAALLIIASGVLIIGNLTAPKLAECMDPVALNNLAWSLATGVETNIRDGARAVELAERACELTRYRNVVMVSTLAAAYAKASQFDKAISTGQEACALASELGEKKLLKRNQKLVVLYQAHLSYHEAALNPTNSFSH
jgi:hypothetical protein